MLQKIKHILTESTFFIFSFYFSRGLRIALAIVTPILIGILCNNISYGILTSSGALVAGLGDNPGTVKVKLNAQCIGALFYFIVVVVSQWLFPYVIPFGIWASFCGFFFSMFFIYGSRAVSISSSALLCLVYACSFQNYDVFTNTIWFMVGVLFYAFISLALWRIQPYRVIEQRISENIKYLSEYVDLIDEYFSLKFKNPEKQKLNEILNKLFEKQEKIHINQEDIRENLFKLRINAKSFSSKGRRMTLTFSALIDLYEHLLSLNLQDNKIAFSLSKGGLKKDFHKCLSDIKYILDELSWSFNLNKKTNVVVDNSILENFKHKVTALENENPDEVDIHVLKHIRFIFKTFYKQVNTIKLLVNGEFSIGNKYEDLDLEKFTQKQNYKFSTFKVNLNLRSNIFRHALRVSAAVLLSYAVCILLEINYFAWVFLTIVLILKPVYGNTKSYSIQRLKGTVIGGVVLIFILLLTQNIYIIGAVVLLCIIGAYSFIPINYKAGVAFVTIFVILLIFIEHKESDNWTNVYHRIGGTAIAVVIAFILSFLFLPTWEYKIMPTLIGKLLNYNLAYFSKISHNILREDKVSETDLKLSRKDVLLGTSNLSSAFQRVISEPRLSKDYKSNLYNVLTLINLLSTRISSLRFYSGEGEEITEDYFKIINNIENILSNCIANIKEQKAVKDIDQLEFFLDNPNLTIYQLKEINSLSRQIYNYILKLKDFQEWKDSQKYSD